MGKIISACILGVFVLDGDRIIDKILFPKDAEQIAKRLSDVTATDEYIRLSVKHDAYFEESDFLRSNLRKLAVEYKFVKDQSELNELMSEISAAETKIKISGKERRDRLIIQTVSALNDLDRILNYMSERLREWYGLHYPEHSVKDHAKFAREISQIGRREGFEGYSKSMGMELKDEDVKILQSYAEQLKQMYALKDELITYLEKTVPEEIPNLNALLGSLLAARLLAHSGSLERLAKMPSSKLQLVGAEKALFKYLKGEQKSVPKFGILFTHPDISGAPREKQGKIARILSSKLTLAARADFYSKKDISKQLVEDYKRKLKEIQ